MKKKILLVDDEAACTLFLGAFLRDSGYEVETSVSGEEAISVGSNFQPDILITDWMLKDKKDGIDVARRLRELYEHLKVIFITGMAAGTLQEKLESLRDCVVVEKPVNLDDVLSLIENIDLSEAAKLNGNH